MVFTGFDRAPTDGGRAAELESNSDLYRRDSLRKWRALCEGVVGTYFNNKCYRQGGYLNFSIPARKTQQ
ncbi:hypothetical protein PAXRUDRAFT_823143 [Paxillus rubicundulus Ve08.2h10]|uniref:Uncharacterized protein n=1 Tax=Paxillus rubicundulus Ve08.2h10 TaxID=930991 RepID=A0A0D0DVS9_9AGAM|nr:hypothetical protein PAXRUDRAFT_823143 [Paxillus rubicundulus Ve08.2h10]